MSDSKSNAWAIRRLLKDLKEVRENPLKNIAALPIENDIFTWHITLRGPRGGPFGKACFHCALCFSATYPKTPPQLYTYTYFPHKSVTTALVNIPRAFGKGGNDQGYLICLSTFDPARKGPHTGWSSSFTVHSILRQMQILLSPQQFQNVSPTLKVKINRATTASGTTKCSRCAHGRTPGKLYPLLNSPKQYTIVADRVESKWIEKVNPATSAILKLYSPPESESKHKFEPEKVKEKIKLAQRDTKSAPVEDDGWSTVVSKPSKRQVAKKTQNKTKSKINTKPKRSTPTTVVSTSSRSAQTNLFGVLDGDDLETPKSNGPVKQQKLSKNARKKLQKLQAEAKLLGKTVEQLQFEKEKEIIERERIRKEEEEKRKRAEEQKQKKEESEKLRKEKLEKQKVAEAKKKKLAEAKSNDQNTEGSESIQSQKKKSSKRKEITQNGDDTKQTSSDKNSNGKKKILQREPAPVAVESRAPLHTEPVAVEFMETILSTDVGFSGFEFDSKNSDKVDMQIDPVLATLPPPPKKKSKKKKKPKKKEINIEHLPTPIIAKIINFSESTEEMLNVITLNKKINQACMQEHVVDSVTNRLYPHIWAVQYVEQSQSPLVEWKQTFDTEKAFAKENQCCFYSKESNEVLGVPVAKNIMSCSPELLSRSVYELLNQRRNMWGSSFDHLLPVYITGGQWETARSLFEDTITQLAGETIFTPAQVLHIVPNLMNEAVISFVKGTRSAHSLVSVYTVMHRVLLKVLEDFPTLDDTLDSYIKRFLKNSSKDKVESLGEFLCLLGTSKSGSWSDCVSTFLRELFARNAKLVLEQHPYLEFAESATDDTTTLLTFQSSQLPLRMTMVHLLLIDIITKGVTKYRTRAQVIANIDSFSSVPPEAIVNEFVSVAKHIQKATTWQEFFVFVRTPMPDFKTLMRQTVTQAIQDSLKKKYHKKGEIGGASSFLPQLQF